MPPSKLLKLQVRTGSNRDDIDLGNQIWTNISLNSTAIAMSERPQRTRRQPAKLSQTTAAEPVVPRKRKAQDDPAERLKFLLQSPKSQLTTMDIAVRRLHSEIPAMT